MSITFDPSKSNQSQSPESMISRPSQDTLPRVREQLPDLNRAANLSGKSVVSPSGSPLPFQQLLTRDSKGESVSQIRQNILNKKCGYREIERSSNIWTMKIAGNYLIIGTSGFGGGPCEIWDVNSLKSLGKLEGHEHQVRCLEVHNGKIYTGSHDGTGRIWDPETKQCLGVIRHDDGIVNMKIVNEKWLITASHKGSCKVWDLNTLECLRTFDGHPHPIRCFDANEDNIVTVSDTAAATGTSDNYCCQTWDMHSGKLLAKVVGKGSISSVKLLQKEFITAGSTYNYKCEVWDVESGKCKKFYRPMTDGSINRMIVIDSLVVLGSAHQWSTWNLVTGETTISEKQNEHVITSMEVADGLVFTGSNWSNVVKVWDPATGKCLQTFANDNERFDGIRCLAYQNGILVSGSGNNPARIWNFSAKEIAAQPTLLSPEELNIKSLQNIADRLIYGQKDNNAAIEDLSSLLNNFRKMPIEIKSAVLSHFFKEIVSDFSPNEADLQWVEKVFCDPAKNGPSMNPKRARAILDYLREKNLKN